jgi:hypothetical protein
MAKASAASISLANSGRSNRRTDTTILSAETPREVTPGLAPEKAMQGGE